METIRQWLRKLKCTLLKSDARKCDTCKEETDDCKKLYVGKGTKTICVKSKRTTR